MTHIVDLLPFWILGVPLIVAVVSLMRLPRQRDLAGPDQRSNKRR